MNKNWYIYLDDKRAFDCENCAVKQESIIPITVRDYNSLIQVLEEISECNDNAIVDFDHDLGEGKNGYDAAKWIVENKYPLIGYHLHTMNPVERNNIRQLLTHYGYKEI